MSSNTPSAIEDMTGEYQLDVAHTRLGFVARHAMVTKVRGSFKEFDGKMFINQEDPSQSTVELRIQTASVDTGQEQRDAHLRSPDFFDVENYPEMIFRTTKISGKGQDFKVKGDLTIKDTTKSVEIELEFTGSAKDPFGNMRAGFEGKTEVNRKDWGLEWNAALETGGFLVSDKVQLEFDISAIKLTPTT
jgi:polyisoprenoid-binding protein YceI